MRQQHSKNAHAHLVKTSPINNVGFKSTQKGKMQNPSWEKAKPQLCSTRENSKLKHLKVQLGG